MADECLGVSGCCCAVVMDASGLERGLCMRAVERVVVVKNQVGLLDESRVEVLESVTRTTSPTFTDHSALYTSTISLN